MIRKFFHNQESFPQAKTLNPYNTGNVRQKYFTTLISGGNKRLYLLTQWINDSQICNYFHLISKMILIISNSFSDKIENSKSLTTNRRKT